jgi:hypothetical protein
VTRTTHVCTGCGAVLEDERHLDRVQGTTGPSWRCVACHTTVPGVVAERINHQRQHDDGTEDR